MQEWLDFQDVLVLPNWVSEVKSRTEPVLNDQWDKVPLSIANMETTGTFKVAKIAAARGWRTYISKKYDNADWRRFIQEVPIEVFNLTVPTFGVTETDFKKARDLWYDSTVQYGILEKTICFDVANGHVLDVWERINQFLKETPYEHVIFGNIGNPDTVQFITSWMSHETKVKSVGIKLGIGSGSVCATRTVTGVGAPQFTLVQKSRQALDRWLLTTQSNTDTRFYLISDGGIRSSGDIIKAFIAGANEVMMGGLFAGCFETGQAFYGSSSEASSSYNPERTPEGLMVQVRREKSVDDQITDIEGGLRSAMTYLGAKTLWDIIGDRAEYLRLVIPVRRQVNNYGV